MGNDRICGGQLGTHHARPDSVSDAAPALTRVLRAFLSSNLVCFIGFAASCASLPGAVELSALQPPEGVLEAGEAKPTLLEWELIDGVLHFAPEPGSDRIGLAFAPGVWATDLEAETELSVAESGAIGIVFRSISVEGDLQHGYAVAIDRNGVSLWCCLDREWRQLFVNAVPLVPGQPHLLSVTVQGDTIAARLDGQAVLRERDTQLTTPGEVGVRAVDGHCAVHSLRVRQLD